MKYTEEQRTKMIEGLWSTSHIKLERFLYRYNMSAEEREDVVQEAFERAYNRLNTWKRECSLEVWLFQISKNIYKNKIRYNHQIKREYSGFDKYSYISTMYSKVSAASVTDPITQLELEKIVLSVIKSKLKKKPGYIGVMKEIFINYTNMSQEELAEAYGIKRSIIHKEKFEIGRRIEEKLRALKVI